MLPHTTLYGKFKNYGVISFHGTQTLQFSKIHLLRMFSHLHYVFKAVASPDPRIQPPVCVVSWIQLNFSSVALNIYDIMFFQSNLGDFGCLIRDDTMSFLHGFLGNNSRPFIQHADILSLDHGLKLCSGSDYKQVLCLSNLRIMVDLVHKGVSQILKLYMGYQTTFA